MSGERRSELALVRKVLPKGKRELDGVWLVDHSETKDDILTIKRDHWSIFNTEVNKAVEFIAEHFRRPYYAQGEWHEPDFDTEWEVREAFYHQICEETAKYSESVSDSFGGFTREWVNTAIDSRLNGYGLGSRVETPPRKPEASVVDGTVPPGLSKAYIEMIREEVKKKRMPSYHTLEMTPPEPAKKVKLLRVATINVQEQQLKIR